MINKISDFIQGIRIESASKANGNRQIVPSEEDALAAGSSGTNEVGIAQHRTQEDIDLEEARKTAERLIVEAEQFKASVVPPKTGTYNHNSDEVDFDISKICDINELVSKVKGSLETDFDDEFFHVTCHIDQNLKSKIEKGEFVELKKLSPCSRSQVMRDERKLQFYYQDGETYFAPMERENKITNVRRWEQAFRVYAAIYCAVNPARSAEIWQYVFTINKAASSFSWENVYFYDVTFRHLMESKPNRSWARTYTQMWTMAMCDPLSKSNGNSFYANNGFGGAASSKGKKFSNDNSSGCNTAAKPKYCWKFNKNRQHESPCTYVHRCSYCDAADHARVNCAKRNKDSANK